MLVVTRAERPDLVERMDELEDLFPEFLYHDAGVGGSWAAMLERWPEGQLLLLDESADRLVGRAATAPIAWDGTLAGLGSGLHEALPRALRDAERGVRPTALMAVVAEVASEHRSAGLSSLLLRGMHGVARAAGLDVLVAPVRPVLKHRYPLTAMERYARWTRPDGLPFDPWMRMHARLGAEVLRVAEASMVVEGTVAEWEGWTGLPMPESGRYVVSGALVPIEVDVAADLGRYVEPNVWMLHPVATGEQAAPS